MRHHYFYSECEGVGNIKSLTSSHSFCFIPIRFQRMCGKIIYVVFWTRWSHDIWSRTSRRCANRNRAKSLEQKVAPHTGARIEMSKYMWHGSRRWPSHLTQVRESKCLNISSRTSRGCANRNCANCSLKSLVAPHAGARIEISVSVRTSPNMAVAP